MIEYRVIDLRSEFIAPEQKVSAVSPERAAEKVLGMKVFRGGARQDLVCRVYWQTSGSNNMVRLYSKAIER